MRSVIFLQYLPSLGIFASSGNLCVENERLVSLQARLSSNQLCGVSLQCIPCKSDYEARLSCSWVRLGRRFPLKTFWRMLSLVCEFEGNLRSDAKSLNANDCILRDRFEVLLSRGCG